VQAGFYAFNGVETRTIGQCGWNSGWVKACFGADVLKVSEGGVVWGNGPCGPASIVSVVV
jgi:hypothetical protein